MKLLQVKEYHRKIADAKWANCDKSKCMSTMFYFYKEDEQGLPTEKRKNGYVAFDENGAIWAKNQELAKHKFNVSRFDKTRPV